MALLSYNQTTKAVGAVQQTNLWELQFSFPQLTIPDTVRFRCVSHSLPEQEQEDVSVTLNRFELTQPSFIKRNGTITYTFVEGEDAETRKLWEQITNLKYSITDKDAEGISQGWLNIKGTIIGYLLDSEGNRTQGYKLVDCDLRPDYSGDLGSDADALQPTLEVLHNMWYFLES